MVPSTKLSIILISALVNLSGVLGLGGKHGSQQIGGRDPYRRLERLDRQGKYWLEWKVNWRNKRVAFNVTVETTGYVGFGLSRKGKMAGADIVIGGVLPSGRAYFSDSHAVGNQIPTEDISQDWTLHTAWENSTHTFLAFSRPFETCDDDHDLPITDDTITLIWAYGEKDDEIQYHFQNRGSFPTYLLDYDLTPERVKEADRSNERLTSLDDMNVWGIYSQQEVAAKSTTYLCTFHKAPSHTTKQHIVGYRPILQSDVDRRHIHHIAMMRCFPPKGANAREFFDRFVDRPGVECYNLFSAANIPDEYCREFIYIFSLGGSPYFLPEHVGVPLSESVDEYYMVQIHHDNPQSIPGIEVNYGIELFYTEKTRKHDAGVMFLGHGFPGSPSFMIPSHSVNHEIQGHCGGACTKKMFSSTGGVNLISAILHTHLSGVAMSFAHVRSNGKELPPIWKDDNYLFYYQTIHTLKEERTILPGDSVISKCTHTTTDRNGTSTVGGYASQNEMCNAIVWFWPRAAVRNDDNSLSVYSVCTSEIKSKEYGDFLNIHNYTWSEEKLDNVVTAPPENAGLTTVEVGTRTEWTVEKRKQLQNYHLYSPKITWCPDLGPEAVGQPSSLPGQGNLPNLGNNEFASTYFEDNARSFQPTESCTGNLNWI